MSVEPARAVMGRSAPLTDPALIFRAWLDWLESHDGRLWRRSEGGNETDYDVVTLIPTPPGRSILTVGQLRTLVERLEAKQRG